ncbi:unnamed protein product, partial [Tilletia controversa]
MARPEKRAADPANGSAASSSSRSISKSKRPKIDAHPAPVAAGEQAPIVTDSVVETIEREITTIATEGVASSSSADSKAGDSSVPAGTVLKISHSLRHQVALPPNSAYNYIPIEQHVPAEPPARVYPFTLDPFQRRS